MDAYKKPLRNSKGIEKESVGYFKTRNSGGKTNIQLKETSSTSSTDNLMSCKS
jgi:hypothetical protein